MAMLFRPVARIARRILQRPPSPPHQVATAGFRVVDSSHQLEEEYYMRSSASSSYYPVRIGQVLESRYQVVGKIGYGSNSTVWLCRDLREHKYVTVKVGRRESAPARREIEVYKYLNGLKTSHTGALLVRTMIDSFELEHSGGRYPSIVHKPLSMSLARLRSKCLDRRLPEQLLKLSLIHCLLAIDFLHSEARLVHCDLQEKNIILGLNEEFLLEEFEKEETHDPSPRKTVGDSIIYQSREIGISKDPGRPIIADFGEARFGRSNYDDDIQPYQYRAPEVILDIPWSYEVDIWNIGVMIWDLFEDKNMFRTRGPEGKNDSVYHLAHMIALLGQPPKDFLERSPRASEFFDANGNWKGLAEIPDTSLEESEENLTGEDKILFLNFIRKMLQWRPEDRTCIKELLRDPWLRDNRRSN